MRLLKLFSLLAFVSLIPLPALAVPAPMPEQELMDKSDLVALVRVLAVTCTSVTTDAATGEELPGYLAQLKVLEIKKGDVKPGEEVVTHLTKRSGGATYASTWWNAKGDDVKSPDTRDLPVTPGETVVPRPESAPQTPL